MFVVAGITGQTGSATAKALLAKGHKVRGIVRDARRAASWAGQGVEVVEADVLDAASLERAFSGAAGAYMLSPPMPQDPDPLGSYEAVAVATRKAAGAAGLGSLVFLSSEGAHLSNGTGPIVGLHRAEQALTGTLPHLTFLRATYFQENWQAVMAAAAEQGVLPTMLAGANRKRAMVATADIGRTAADILVSDRAPPVVELAGPEAYSPDDVAHIAGLALGREVSPVVPPREAWTSILEGAGLGAAYARLLAEMYDGINSGLVRFSGDGEQRRGRVSLQETVAGWVPQHAAVSLGARSAAIGGRATV